MHTVETRVRTVGMHLGWSKEDSILVDVNLHLGDLQEIATSIAQI
jgi:hypothetical protein